MDKNNPNFLTFNRRQFIKTSAVLAGVSQLSLPFTSKAENNSIAESTEKLCGILVQVIATVVVHFVYM